MNAVVNDQVLYYDRVGAGEPLLMIMGMGGTHVSWGERFLESVARDFDVVVYDHRGVGNSSRAREAFSIIDLAGDAAGLLDHLAWDSAHVLGVSMGGMVAQELALARPALVRTLTLGGTSLGGDRPAVTADAHRRIVEALSAGDRERTFRVLWEINVSASFAASEREFAAFCRRALESPATPRLVMAQLTACDGHDMADRASGILAPTLVIHGGEDQVIPSPEAARITGTIPQAHLELLGGVGHLIFIESPDEVAELLRAHARGGRRPPVGARGG